MTDRLCVVCGHRKPINAFYTSGHGNGRRRTCIRCLNDKDARARRASGARARHQRINARGDVRCNRCQAYRPREDFKPHPSREGVFWSYCKPCTREIDRERYAKRTSTLDGAIAELEKKYQRKQRMLARKRQNRIDFVRDAITQLRGRGLTKSEIARLVGCTVQSIYRWEAVTSWDDCRITENAEKRFGVVLAAAIEVLPPPNRNEIPNYRRRLPHPQLSQLLAMVAEDLERYPLRSSWVKGARDHERRKAA
jgi:transcriptional regulator with XRE-family HTH domain/Pyruvate/2-oxoacid:ferredoxin oxidoreductase delta subunit